MPDQRIYYVPPRFLGPVTNWTGLLDHVAGMNFNALWLSPFLETTAVTKDVHGQNMTGSYYAIRDHFRMDPDYSTGDAARDAQELARFCTEAAARGIRVYGDLVFNHIAADHPLVTAENTLVQTILHDCGGHYTPLRDKEGHVIGVRHAAQGQSQDTYFKFKRRDDLSLEIPGPAHDPWSDVAPINYRSPEAMKFFVTGDTQTPGYFKQVIDWHLRLGFTGFRCDAAYLVPPEAWQELIRHAHTKDDNVVFLAETLGGPQHMIGALGAARITDKNGHDRPAFDYGMLGTFWWNFEDPGLPFGENYLMHAMSRYGGAGSPDNHDTDCTLATALRRIFNRPAGRDTDEKLADAAVRDYAVCVLACAAGYMQMGYEFGNEKQNHVFRGQVTEADWKNLQSRSGGALDITGRIAAINALKDALGTEGCKVNFKSISRINDDKIIRMQVEYIDASSGQKKADVVLLLNRQPENGPVYIDSDTGTFGLQHGWGDLRNLRDIAIFHTPVASAPAQRARPPQPKFG